MTGTGIIKTIFTVILLLFICVILVLQSVQSSRSFDEQMNLRREIAELKRLLQERGGSNEQLLAKIAELEKTIQARTDSEIAALLKMLQEIKAGSGDQLISKIAELEKMIQGIKTANSSGTTATATSTTEISRDVVYRRYSNDPDLLNPITSNDTASGEFQRLVTEGMADRKMSDPDKLEPKLAERWEVSSDNLEYTIYLRKGVKWHPASFPDGTPIPSREFTAEDVKFTFDVILNPHVRAAHIRNYYNDLESVKIVDKYTVKIKWRNPYFLSEDFTLGVGIIPKYIYSVDEKGEPLSLDVSSQEFGEKFNKHWFNNQLCGTGPMKFVRWTRNDKLILERNPDYWGKPFFFEKLTYYNVPNPNSTFDLLLNNSLDFIGLTPMQYENAKDESKFKSGDLIRVSYDYPSYSYIGYNLTKEFFKDIKVRRALSYAIPIQTIIDTILYGLAVQTTGPFNIKSPGYDKSLQPYEYNLDKSRGLLEEAGWKDTDGNGLIDKNINGQKIDFEFEMITYADSPDARKVAEVIKENLKKLGINLIITPVKWDLMLQKTRAKEFDAVMLGWALGWKQDPYQIWHSSQAEEESGSNSISYKNPEVDALIEELRRTFDPKRQVEIYHKLHRIIYDEQPYTFLYVIKATAGYNSRIKNVNFYPIRPCFDDTEWYVPLQMRRVQ